MQVRQIGSNSTLTRMVVYSDAKNLLGTAADFTFTFTSKKFVSLTGADTTFECIANTPADPIQDSYIVDKFRVTMPPLRGIVMDPATNQISINVELEDTGAQPDALGVFTILVRQFGEWFEGKRPQQPLFVRAFPTAYTRARFFLQKSPASVSIPFDNRNIDAFYIGKPFRAMFELDLLHTLDADGDLV